MPARYVLSRKWSLTDRFTITDGSGLPQFEVQGRFGLARRLSLRDVSGVEVATISGKALSSRFEILVDGQPATVRPRGVFRTHYEIDSPGGPLEAQGNFSGRTFTVTRGGAAVATVSQQRTLKEQFAVDVADGENPVLMLAVILVIETIRDDRRRAAGAAGACRTRQASARSGDYFAITVPHFASHVRSLEPGRARLARSTRRAPALGAASGPPASGMSLRAPAGDPAGRHAWRA